MRFKPRISVLKKCAFGDDNINISNNENDKLPPSLLFLPSEIEHLVTSHHIQPSFTTSLPTTDSTPNSLVRLRSSTHLGGPEFSSPGETVSRT